MSVKTFCACLMGLFFISPPVFAQDQASSDEHQPPSVDEIVQRMQSKLKLTPDQVTAITPIIQKYSDKRDELRQSMEDGTSDRDSIRGQMKALRAGENQELGQVLSADQLGQWRKMQSQMRHQHGGADSSQGSGASGPGGGG